MSRRLPSLVWTWSLRRGLHLEAQTLEEGDGRLPFGRHLDHDLGQPEM